MDRPGQKRLRGPFSAEAARETLGEGRALLRQRYYQSNNGTTLLRNHSRLVDDVLRHAWHEMDMPGSAALVAVGGYGRRELFPYSDIDLLVLVGAGNPGADAVDSAAGARLERWVRLLWDLGLDIGHSVRTVAECVEEATGDITVQTSLLEARLLAGCGGLFEEFADAMQKMLQPRKFFDDKQHEQRLRHARYQDAAYKLEPNMKEGPGGLRDLQNIMWISRGAGLGKSWPGLARTGLITQREARLVQRHQAILQNLRIRLHYLAGRREDRLLFDYQIPLAQELGIAGRTPRSASEMLMQRYYRATRTVTQINAILLLTLRTEIFPRGNASAIVLNERFQKRGELLEARDENVFRQYPGAILESVLLLQQHPELRERNAATLRAMWRAAPSITGSFRRDPCNRALFMEILRQPRGLTRELRLLNRFGILGRYIPAFGRIVGQMQHDLFHVYTVDEHILMVVRNLRRFMAPGFAHEYPLCSHLIREFERPEVLYLAGLFHDIAKGRQGDHSKLGKAIAHRFCKQHGMLQEDTDLVAWLVEHHLLMSMTAQKKDISDADVIAAFAGQAASERRLVALYLLTVADIRGTSPKVWNAWKGKLLEDLFRAAQRHLSGESVHADRTLKNRRNRILELLDSDAVSVTAREQFWSMLGPAYLLGYEPQEIAWHIRQLSHQMTTAVPVVKARISPAGAGIDVLVYTADQKDLFARICGFFDRIDYNIVEARIHTTRHGYALDSFLVLDPLGTALHHHATVSFIEQELTQQLAQQAPLQPPVSGRLSRHLRHFPIRPKVGIELDEKGNYHVLSIVAGDQPGLLSRIAQVLVNFRINVHSARINTLGERAEDTFLITGDVLSEPRTVIQLETRLIEMLQTDGIVPGKSDDASILTGIS